MKKLAVSTVACMNTQPEQMIASCRKYGIEGIEIRLDPDNGVMGYHSEEGWKHLKDLFDAAGIQITNLGSSICMKGYEQQIRQKLISILKAADILGCIGIRVFLGNFSQKIQHLQLETDYAGIVAQLKEMCHIASDCGKEIWIETHNEFATGKVLKQLIADVNCENLKIIWDIMHPLEDGEDITETWDAIGSRIAHVHIKDGYDRRDGIWHDYYYTCLGEGAVPIQSILELLQKVKYDGYLSFEWESAWREELKQYDNSIEWVLKQYTEYMEQCNENLLKISMSEWNQTDASGNERTEAFEISAYAAEAAIDNRVRNACLKKYGFRVVLSPGQTYRLSVPYRVEDETSNHWVYGMITLYDAKGAMKRRIYLEEPINGKKELIFRTMTETLMKLELGIKRFGKVVFYTPSLIKVAHNKERRVRAASVFIQVNTKLTYKEHLTRIAEGIEQAATDGVDLIGLAENLNTRVSDIPENEQFGTMNGLYCSMLKELAKKHHCYIFFSFRELDEEGVRRNTAVLLGRNGELVGKYYKTHITITEYEAGIVPGDSYPVFDTDFGRVGLLVCWDTYFPEPAQAMARQGAEMLLVPTAGNPTYRHIARAKENGIYVMVACFSNSVDSGICSAKIVDPCGEILAHTNEDGQAAKATIDLNEEKHIYWLSVGPCDAVPSNIYRHEYRNDL